MITINILKRVFFIKAEQYGTAFTLDINEQEYLITARHLLGEGIVKGSDKKVSIRLFISKKWHEITAELIGHGNGEIDISVLKLPHRLSHPGYIVNPTIKDLALGQDVFFLGFPYKMWSNVENFLGGLPCPFVKKGAVSSIEHDSPQKIYVDAINNEGFSGGPLCFYPYDNHNMVHIAGVVVNYKIENEPVIDLNDEDTGFRVAYNTGFLVAYNIKYVFEIIDRNKK